MRGFEQGASTARCTIIQFHRPAELKLIRICERYAFPVCSPDIQGFLLLGQGPVFWPGVFRVPKNGGAENQKTTCYASG